MAALGNALRWALSLLVALGLLAGLESLARRQTPPAPAGLRVLTLERVWLPPAGGARSPARVVRLRPPEPVPVTPAAAVPAAAASTVAAPSTAPPLVRAPAPPPRPLDATAPRPPEPVAAAAPPAQGAASAPVTAPAPPAPPSGGVSSSPDAAARRSPPARSSSPAPRLVAERHLDAGFRLAAPVQPRYPEPARRLGRPGRVQVELEVAPDGTVTGLEVRDEAPGWGFAAAAREAFAQARFTPPTANGEPVRVRWRKTLHFYP